MIHQVEVSIACPMVFDRFPVDEQECKVLLGSEKHSADELSFEKARISYDPDNNRMKNYRLI